MNVSLPIKIFEPRSFLEKTAQDYSYAPYFLDQAMLLKDSMERFKLISAWMVATMHVEP
jgi:hypothetical protein